MASRPLINAHKLIVNAAMTADIYGTSLIETPTLVSYTIVWTGSPVGTFTIEVCNDAQVNSDGTIIANTGTWTPLPFTNGSGATVTSVAAGGASGSIQVSMDLVPFSFIRVHYAFTSGTGTLNVTMSAKVS